MIDGLIGQYNKKKCFIQIWLESLIRSSLLVGFVVQSYFRFLMLTGQPIVSSQIQKKHFSQSSHLGWTSRDITTGGDGSSKMMTSNSFILSRASAISIGALCKDKIFSPKQKIEGGKLGGAKETRKRNSRLKRQTKSKLVRLVFIFPDFLAL